MSFADRLAATALVALAGLGACATPRTPALAPAAGSSARCEALASSSPKADIAAEVVSAGYCRVTATLRPVPGSVIGFQLWLPAASAWTGRLQMLGNGGYSSQLPLAAMGEALARGSAVVATDTGHQGDDPDFAAGRPQAIVDWASRAVHLSAVEAKKLVAHFYARPAAHSYFNGCSTGGHQALMEAQRFPEDFDGIVAGAPGANRVRLNAAFLWQYLANHRRGDDANPILSRSDLALLAQGAFAACRGANGRSAGGLASDAWLNDPAQCRFDPRELACKPGHTEQCLSEDKIEAARKMYRGAPDPRGGGPVTTPWLPGSETGWSAYWADPANPRQPARLNFWRIWARDDPAWSWWDFDYGAKFDRVLARLGPRIDATDPDLGRFRRSGGKLLQYHGFADPVVSPLDSIRYFEAVRNRGGGRDPGDWYRLFMVPGMGHCGGGPGFWRLDAQQSIERWVERGVAHDTITASAQPGPADSSRPLCPYPAKAVRVESGSFICTKNTRMGMRK